MRWQDVKPIDVSRLDAILAEPDRATVDDVPGLLSLLVSLCMCGKCVVCKNCAKQLPVGRM